jgi:hypothetical protein
LKLQAFQVTLAFLQPEKQNPRVCLPLVGRWRGNAMLVRLQLRDEVLVDLRVGARRDQI